MIFSLCLSSLVWNFSHLCYFFHTTDVWLRKDQTTGQRLRSGGVTQDMSFRFDFPVLRILGFSYLCRYWGEIPQVISWKLSTHHKMSLCLVFWTEIKWRRYQPSSWWQTLVFSEHVFALPASLGCAFFFFLCNFFYHKSSFPLQLLLFWRWLHLRRYEQTSSGFILNNHCHIFPYLSIIVTLVCVVVSLLFGPFFF